MTTDFSSIIIETLGTIVYPRGATLGPRVRNRFELAWAQSGSFSITVGQREMHCRDDLAIFLTPGLVNVYQFNSLTPTRQGFFTFRFDDPRDDRLAAELPAVLAGRSMALYLPLLNQLAEQFPPLEQAPTADMLRLKQVAAAMLSTWTWRLLDHRRAAAVNSAALSRALDFIERRWHQGYERAISVDMLARASSVTTRQLNRLFQSEFGISTRDYLRRQKLEHAAKLLDRSNLSLQEIAAASGFANEFAFSRAFKSVFGEPPARYRRDRREIE